MSANVYAELADRFGVTANYVADLARAGRLPELLAADPHGTGAAGNPGQDDVEQGIYERAKRLEQIRGTFSESERAVVDTEVRMQRWLHDEVYDVQRGRR